MKRHIFILIPSLIPTGPIKGAIALASALSAMRAVTLVSLKGGNPSKVQLPGDIKYVSLASKSIRMIRRVKVYQRMLKKAGGRDQVVSISLCFSADMANLFCRRVAVTCSSIRSNLFVNYKMDYGLAGLGLAVGHLVALNLFDHVVVMTESMARHVKPYLFRHPAVIGNFVDEKKLDAYRRASNDDDINRFVFLGSLTKRKQPLCIVKSIAELRDRGLNVTLDVIGQGPLEVNMLSEIQKLGLQEIVRMHGQLSNPYDVLAKASALVLPSLSEGISRAALEALHLGVPCVLRNVDGNSELINSGFNGLLFDADDELPDVMIETMKLKTDFSCMRESMIPEGFRQKKAVNRYLALIE